MDNFRMRWFPLLFWVSEQGVGRTLSVRIGDISLGTAVNFYERPVNIALLGTAIADTVLTQSDLAASKAVLYIGGNPAITATTLPNIAANTNYGGCGQVRHLVFLPNYNPTPASPTANPEDVIIDHLFERTYVLPTRIKSYHMRMKSAANLDLLTDCDVPSDISNSIINSDTSFLKKGIQLGYGDYYECVNTKMISLGDVVLSFRLTFSQLPTTEVNLVSMTAKSLTSLVPTITTTAQSTLLPVWFNFIKLGVFLTPAGTLKIINMGLDKTLTDVLAVNTEYTISIVAKAINDDFYAGVLEKQTFLMVYIDGILKYSFQMMGNQIAFQDVSNSNAERNNYFYIGDFMSNSIDRYNYAFVTPNPLNSFGPSNTEKTFTTPFMYLHDVLVYENATLTREPLLLPTDCLLGVPGTSQCLICNPTYVLTSTFTCVLKSSLPSFAVYSQSGNMQIECGSGLFFSTVLGQCLYCTIDCEQCTGVGSTDCQLYKYCPTCTICSSGCNKCISSTLCTACRDGYSLKTLTATTANCVACTMVNCKSCPSATPALCDECLAGYYINTGTSQCTPCDATCKTCQIKSSSGTKCTSCASGKYLVGTTCVPLPNNLYLWKGNPITRYCFPTCTNCITSEINKCTACYSDYLAVVSYTDILKGNPSTFSCDSKCPVTHFYTLDPQILTLPPGTGIKYCMPCESVVQNCIQCYRASSTSSLICLNCRAGFFVSVDASTSYSNTCQKCDDSCAECSGDMLTCTKCATGKMLKLVSGKVRCVPDDKTLALTNRVCPYNKFLYQGQCLDECPEGTYRRKYYTDDCASCTVATTGCFDCDKVTSTCTTCHPNYKSFAAGACYFCNQNNIQCCAYGFGWTVSGTCSACSVANSVDCLMPSNAIQCNSVGSYVLNALGSCLSPITNCNSYNFDASKCTQCSKGTMLSGSSCVATCGSLYEYFSNSNKICSACHSYCTTCSAPGLSGKCSACAAATAGIYPVTGGCNQCDNIDGCATYSTSTAPYCFCTACKSGYLSLIPQTEPLTTGKICVSDCPTGYYKPTTSDDCFRCANCDVCTGPLPSDCLVANSCTLASDTAAKRTLVLSSSLISDATYQTVSSFSACCVSGFYPKSSGTGKYLPTGTGVVGGAGCESCNVPNTCQTCTSNAAGTCTTAAAGYYVSAGNPTACDASLSVCLNSGAVYEPFEVCKYGSTSTFSGTTWTGSCKTTATAPCVYYYKKAGVDTCGKCDTVTYLDLSTNSCSGTCAAGSVAVKDIKYKIVGKELVGNLCVPTLLSTTSFNQYYIYGVNSCEAGYYLFKSGSKMTPFISPAAEAELLICGKCHPDCKECYDYSRYACSKCATGKYLYMSTCIDACPIGFIDDGTGACRVADCPAYYYKYDDDTSTPLTFYCVKMCDKGMWADNSTWTCQTCNAACEECWGPAATDCRQCATAGTTALGDGTCVTCAAGTYMEDHANFVCAPVYLKSYIDSVTAATPTSDPQLTGVTLVDASNTADPSLTIDASNFLTFSAPAKTLVIPDITYAETKVCYRTLVEFQIELMATAPSLTDTSWHNKKIEVKNDTTSLGTISINKWDFEDFKAPTVFKTSTIKKYNRFFVNNLNCTNNILKLRFSSDYTDTNNVFGIRNVRTYWYQCPLQCISCNTSTSCFRCVEGKFFYLQPNECQVPYTTLKVDEPGLIEVYNFLFKPQSVFLFFTKTMNFSLGDQFPYFFPVYQPVGSKRLLQTTSLPDPYLNSETLFVANNFMELKISNLSTSLDQTGYYTFRYPLVDVDRVGYNYTTIPVVYLANNPITTLMQAYVRILSANKFIFRIAMSAVTFVMVSALGANWVLLETCQKLYVLLFVSVSYSGDVELFMDLMDYSFFGWTQYLHKLALGENEYWQKVKYDEYISKYDRSRSIDKEFLDYIPPRKLGKYLVRKSFLVHTDAIIALFALMAVFLILLAPIRWFILKKYYYKEKLVKFINALDTFLRFKFFARLVCMTFAPFVFYGLANMSKIEMGKQLGMISAVCTFVFLGLWGLSWVQYFIWAFLMPSEVEAKSLTEGFKVVMVIPFHHFMEYLKHPETGGGIGSGGAEDDEDDPKMKSKKWVNEHMVIKDNSGQNQVFTLNKDDLKKGGAGVYKAEDPSEEKDKKKKKPSGFIPIEKILEDEEKEREAKKAEREAEKKKEQDEKEDEKKSDDEEEKKEGEEGDDKEEGDGKEKDKGKKKDDEDDKKKEEEESSSDDDKTGESSEEELGNNDVRNVGKLLSKAVAKVERGPGCCQCKCIRKNKCLNKFNFLMERTAKFYTIIRIAHIAMIAALIWYFGDNANIQVIIIAASQTVFFLWTILCRPYIYFMLNISLILQEFCFTGLAWLIFLLANPSMAAMKEILSLVMLMLCLTIFVVAIFTFLAFFITALVKWLNSFGNKDPLRN